LLIARFRFRQADDAFREQTTMAIQSATEAYEREILQYQGQVEEGGGVLQDSAMVQGPLAYRLNEYAWLVSNTSGDFTRARRFSRRSLQIDPGNEAYLDTLGRCYFAEGDLENAIKYQQFACERAPHEQLIRRQLESFISQHMKESEQKVEND
jgi:tetratricopeptide (TPR) repeat protein